MNESRPELVLYGRAGCHLCEAMEAELTPHLGGSGLQLRQVDISGEPELEARYGLDIPVLTCAGREICRHFFDLAALRARLAELGL